MAFFKNKNKGFTLIELLVVVGIIGILASVIIVNLNSVRDKSRIAAGRQFEANIYHEAGDMLVGEWNFEEGSGILANDLSGNGNSGSVAGSSAWSTDVPSGVGHSIQLNGSSNYVQVPYSSSLSPTSAVTFGAWFKTNNISLVQKIIAKSESGGYQLSLNGGSCPANTFCALVSVGGNYYYASYPISSISSGRWYYGLGSYDGETIRLFLDGKEVASNASPSGNISYSVNNPLCIGNEPGSATCSDGDYFNGYIDNVRVYAKSLTAMEIKKIYLAEKEKFDELAKR